LGITAKLPVAGPTTVSADAAGEVEGTTTGGAVVAAAVGVTVAVAVADGVVGIGTDEPQAANTIASAIPATARGNPLNTSRLTIRAM
jgi:hypothetical protein